MRTVGWRASCECCPHCEGTGQDTHDGAVLFDCGCTGRCTILDPFAGTGTVGLVALRHNRNFTGIELNPAYCEMARNRIRQDAPLLNTPAETAA